MYAIFGISSMSLPSIWDRLVDYQDDFKLNSFDLFNADKPNHDVLLFTDVTTVKHYAPMLMQQPSVGVVFDSPLALHSIKSLIMLDKLPETPPSLLQKAINLIKQKSFKHVDLSPTAFAKVDLIDNLIAEQQNKGVLGLYNTLVMKINPNLRNAAIQLILRFMFGEITRSTYESVSATLLSTPARDLSNKLIIYLQTPEGRGLINALQNIYRAINSRLRTNSSNSDLLGAVDFVQIAQKFGLDDPYELRYLVLAYHKAFGARV